MRCTVCAFPQANEVETLLATGISIRRVSQMFGLSRSSVSRHSQHAQLTASKPAVIAGQGGPNGTGGSLDPLGEALELAARARTPRERLRALEQVRAASKLALRGTELDDAGRALLDANVARAEEAFRTSIDFETQARALSGWRSAILERLAAVQTEQTIEVPGIRVSFVNAEEGPPADDEEEPASAARPFRVSVSQYFQGVPSGFRDVERFEVRRSAILNVHGTEPIAATIEVLEKATGAVVWADE